MGFINNANQIIGANMRYLQQFQANPQTAGGSQSAVTSGSQSADEASMQAMMPMLMMMLMMKLLGLNPGQPGQQPFPQLPGFPGAPLPPAYGHQPGSSPQNAAQWIQQNPAYLYLSTLIPGLATATSTSTSTATSASPALQANIAKPDFAVNSSLADAMNALLSSSQNVSRHSLGTQLLSGATNGTDLDALKAAVQSEMLQEGRSTRDIEALGILFDAMRNNNDLSAARLLVKDNSPAQVDRLLLSQQELSQQWDGLMTLADNAASDSTAASADATDTSPSTTNAAATSTSTTTSTTSAPDNATLIQNVRTALADGRFDRQQLGQTLKYLLDKGPASALPQIGALISSLMKSGDLNVLSFLNAKYLDKLSLERKQALLNAVNNAGLTNADGKTNSRFAAFVLDTLSRSENTSTLDFVHKFLQNEWLQKGSDTTSAEGKALQSLLLLAGINGIGRQPLSFPA